MRKKRKNLDLGNSIGTSSPHKHDLGSLAKNANKVHRIGTEPSQSGRSEARAGAGNSTPALVTPGNSAVQAERGRGSNSTQRKKDQKPASRLQKMLAAIESNGNAKRAYRKILGMGYDKTDLLGDLFWAFGGEPDELRVGLRVLAHLRDYLPELADRLVEDAEAIAAAQINLRNGGVRECPDDTALIAMLRDRADSYRVYARGFKKGTDSVKKDFKTGLLVGGRGEAMFDLVSELEDLGESNPYATLAPLQAAIQAIPDPILAKIADALRNTVNRYRKQAAQNSKPGC